VGVRLLATAPFVGLWRVGAVGTGGVRKVYTVDHVAFSLQLNGNADSAFTLQKKS
jgi:hypothetical protein